MIDLELIFSKNHSKKRLLNTYSFNYVHLMTVDLSNILNNSLTIFV